MVCNLRMSDSCQPDQHNPQPADKMADELKQAAAQVDRWCLLLEGLIDPQLRHCKDLALYDALNTKGDGPSQVRACKKVLGDMWETYQKLYNGAHFRRV